MRISFLLAALIATPAAAVAATTFDVELVQTRYDIFEVVAEAPSGLSAASVGDPVECFDNADGTIEVCRFDRLRALVPPDYIPAFAPIVIDGTVTVDADAATLTCSFDFYGLCSAGVPRPFLGQAELLRRGEGASVTTDGDTFTATYLEIDFAFGTLSPDMGFFTDDRDLALAFEGWTITGSGGFETAFERVPSVPLPAGLTLLASALGALMLRRR